MRISQYRLAIAIGIPESRINAIVKGRRAITADTDLRLCRFFGLSEGFWLRMQSSHYLRVAHRQLGDTLSQILPWRQEVLNEVRGDVREPGAPQNQA
jgi:addiction module HigA family antidote